MRCTVGNHQPQTSGFTPPFVSLTKYTNSLDEKTLCLQMRLSHCFVKLCLWSTDAVISSTGIFVAIDNNTFMGQNDTFLFYAKNH